MKTFIFLTTFLFSVHASALNWVADIVISPAPMTYSGPANSIVPGNIIGTSWSATANVQEVFWCGLVVWCTKGTMEPSSGTVSTGMNVTVDGKSYTIFESGIPGIGYIIGLKDFNGNAYVPLQSGVTQTYPADGTNDLAQNLGWSGKVTFIKTGQPLVSGVYVTPSIDAAMLTAYNNETKTARVIINPTTISVTATGCVVITKSANVNLGDVDIRQLTTVGSMAAAGAFNVTLDCDANISLNAVLSDQTHPSNDSNAVSLTSDSTAGALGVAFYYNGSGPIQLGKDSSVAGTTNQFHITTTTSAQSITMPFQVRYIRMGDITPGTANALAGLTFSYQ
ncbi:fimbrial protein [Enterobacter sp. CC120223-11]|uniref:fimbrial protein n=1 Tax=Enterobacter sp. CC120223-11 TaxID=1378073 RepID=UPI000BD261E0|nr:fimbrial protein [Enterobacter sp. CC120223-11]SNY61474.1 Pilin (type 1 fimbria component protein) [Enterobacter sp. CC120223-11]